MSERVSKGARDVEGYRRPAFFYASAREGMADFLRSLPDGPRRVLLPAFIGRSDREGSGVHDPVVQSGFEASFYGLRRDLTVELVALEAALGREPLSAVVLIHYYGRTDPASAAVQKLCRRHRVPLVEDLAHGFYSSFVGGRAGSVGDLSLFSLHKMLPLDEGGAVTYADARLVRTQASTRPHLAQEVLSYDWRGIARARREAFLRLTDHLTSLAARRPGHLELVWPHLGPEDVPQTLPVYVLSADRDKVYARMNGAGFGVVSLYHTLIPEVASRPEHDGAHWSARHVLNLPVHQDVDLEQLTALVAALETCLTEAQN